MCEALDRLLAAIPGVRVTVDRFGNRLARISRGETHGSPVAFIAHLDHPGFILPEGAYPHSGTDRVFEMLFEGRVATEFFAGSYIRLFRSADDTGISARILETTEELPEIGARRVTVEAAESPEGTVLAMWDVPVFEAGEDGFLRARVCDDLAGCAALVESLRRLSASDATQLDYTVIFTRAEEAGFCGLLCLLSEELPAGLGPDTLYLSVETSGETPGVSLGGGAIIRCGDRSTTFDGGIVDLLAGLTAANGINARRALMDRGTCEATPVARAGLRAGGVCIPVRNYHNQDLAKRTIAPEAVSIADAEALVAMMVSLGIACGEGTQPKSIILHDYDQYLRKGQNSLAPLPLAAQRA